MDDTTLELLDEINTSVDKADRKHLDQKYRCLIKEKYILMLKSQTKALEKHTQAMEQKFDELKKQKEKLTDRIKLAKDSIATMENLERCIKKELANEETEHSKLSNTIKENVERVRNNYDNIKIEYESYPLALRRKELLELKSKYTLDSNKLNTMLECYKDDLVRCRKENDRIKVKEFIRLAESYKIGINIVLTMKRIQDKECTYMQLLTDREFLTTQRNSAEEKNIETIMSDVNQIELMDVQRSLDEENATNTAQTTYSMEKSDLKEKFSYLNQETVKEKSTIDSMALSFWKKTAPKTVHEPNEVKINKTYEEYYLKPSISLAIEHTNDIFKEDHCFVPPLISGDIREKKVSVLKDVILKKEEVAKMLMTLPVNGSNVNVVKSNDVIIQQKKDVKINKENLPETHTERMVTETIQLGSERDADVRSHRENNSNNKDNKVVETTAQQEQNNNHNNENDYQHMSPPSVTRPDQEISAVKRNTNVDQTVSKFFTKQENPPNDEPQFLQPPLKKAKVEANVPQQPVQLEKKLLRDIEMELEKFNTQTSYFSEFPSIKSPEFDFTLDSDSKSVASFMLSPPELKNFGEIKRDDKNPRQPSPPPPASSNFLDSLFGGESHTKSSNRPFNFNFGKKSDKPSRSLLF